MPLRRCRAANAKAVMRLCCCSSLLLSAIVGVTACSAPTSYVLETRSGLVYGTVRDTETLDPLPGASVWFVDEDRDIENQDGLGAIADINGEYEIHVVPQEKLVLRVAFVGYASKQMSFTPRRSDTLRVDWLLAPGEELGEIIVCGGCDA